MRAVLDATAFAELAADHRVFFYYCGYFSQPIIEASADAIRLRLASEDVAYRVQRRVLSSFIEMAQNIVHYSAEALTDPGAASDEMRYGTLSIAAGEAGIRLVCANPVDLRTHQRLEPKLAVLSRMNLEEIREAYRTALRADERDEASKGGGIGLLTLARDSTAPLVYSFTPSPASPDLRIFQLSVTI
jgi:hypothetical protein